VRARQICPLAASIESNRTRIIDGVRSRLALLGLVLALASHASPARALVAAVVPERPVEFWVVEPNEGDSAGGHAALRIGETLFHVEHRGDGLIADRRTSRARFEEIYRERGNRAITKIALALESDRVDQLEDTLVQRFFDRSRRLGALDALDRRNEFLAAAQARGHFAIDVPGLGLYEQQDGPASCGTQRDAAIGVVRREIDRRHGPSWLLERRARARRLAADRLAEVVAPENTRSSGPGGAFRRLREAVQTWTAFEILVDCRRVRSDHIRVVDAAFVDFGGGGSSGRSSGGGHPRVEGDEGTARDRDEEGREDTANALERRAARARWRAARDQQRARLVELVASDREDVGLALLLAAARLQTLDRSLASGRLHVLDPQTEGKAGPDAATALGEGLPADWMPLLEARARVRVRTERDAFEHGSGPLEARLAGLEQALHDARHVARRTRHRPPKLPSPSASYAIHYVAAERVLPWPDGLSLDELARTRVQSQGRADRMRAELGPSLEYRLFTRNCVTELLGVLALLGDVPTRPTGDPGHASQETSAVDVLRGRFIPVVAGRHVAARLAASPPQRLDSVRELLLRDVERRGTGARWREAMTLSARTYRPHSGDSSFLLFSDGPIWLRPVAGVTNLAYGLGAAGVGVLAAPFDAGRQVRRGLLGAIMSVPELFFFQVRQGSYPVSPPLLLGDAPSPGAGPGAELGSAASSGSRSTR